MVVTQKDQTATGELGIFDMPTNTVTLTGNVVMTQGQNVLRGDKLVVDLTSGVSRVECGKERTRPRGRPVRPERRAAERRSGCAGEAGHARQAVLTGAGTHGSAAECAIRRRAALGQAPAAAAPGCEGAR